MFKRYVRGGPIGEKINWEFSSTDPKLCSAFPAGIVDYKLHSPQMIPLQNHLSVFPEKKENVWETGRITNRDILQGTSQEHRDLMSSVLPLRACTSTGGRHEEKRETASSGQWSEDWAWEKAVSSPSLATTQHDFINFSPEGADTNFCRSTPATLLISTAVPSTWTQ